MPIAYDATSSGQDVFASSVTFSHTCSGTDRLLLVGVVCSNNVTISSVTYASVGMTAVETGNAFQRLYALTAPATGANNVVVTLSGPDACLARAVSYTGVDQATPYSGTQSSATGDAAPSVTVTSATGSLVAGMSAYIDAVGQSVQTVGAGQTSRGSTEQTGHYLVMSDEAGAASVTHSYGRSGAFYYHQRIIAISLAEAGGGGSTIRRLGFVRPARRG